MECLKPTYLHKQEMTVPCGKCPMCAAQKRSDWATRLHFEARRHLVKKFVTLTYADAHLKWAHGKSQLCKRDLQLWFKKLRKAGYKLRYYAVGEYGSKTFRPHYHVILFGDVPDEIIRQCWQHGQIHIGNVTQASIMYCLGYLVNSKGWQMVTHREKPFSLMSRKPGLGASYLTPDAIEWHNARCFSDLKNYTVIDGVQRHLPRYYKLKLFSKINLVRIAVRDQKNYFNKQLQWLRSPSMSKLQDPSAYKRLQMENLAKRIRAHSKSTQQI